MIPAAEPPEEIPAASVAVIGLGLMGGSLARELASRGVSVLAYDADPATLASARIERLVHVELDDSLRGIEQADLIVLATPVDEALGTLARIAPFLRDDAVVTDVGSTKAGITAQAESLGVGARFAGSHPLTGDHRSGWKASRTGLYRDALVFICPTPSTSPATVQRIARFWGSLGGRCSVLRPDEHDARMAWMSHLPQVVSSALAATIRDASLTPDELGAGGRDVTRLAGSSPEMWSAICLANREPLQAAIARLEERLAAFRGALIEENRQEVLSFFREARDWVS